MKTTGLLISMRTSLMVLAMLLHTAVAMAQRERNYIYIFDCTASMKSDKINMWEHAKTALDRTITSQSSVEGSMFTVVPFQDHPHVPMRFDAACYARTRSDLSGTLDKYISSPHSRTNIYEAFTAGMDLVDPAMDNRVYLLTDGIDEVRGVDEVCRLIRQWCASHRNTRFFYVMLDGMASNPSLDKALEECGDAYGVKCRDGVIPQIADISSSVHANTLELDRTYSLRFSEPCEYPLSVRCDDPYFDVSIAGGKASGGRIDLKFDIKTDRTLQELNDLLAADADNDGIYSFGIDITSPDPLLFIANPEVEVHMANRRMRSLEILSGECDEYHASSGAQWYPAFLWSAEHPQDTVKVDLSPVFSNTHGRSTATFTITPDDNTSGCDITFNGRHLNPDGKFTLTENSPAIIGICFTPDAADGKHYFTITHTVSRDIEMINSLPVGNMTPLSIRTTFKRCWNPLATILFWIAACILAALLIWFVFLQRQLYPRFGKMSLELIGPGSYYTSKKLKGYRMVVLTASRRRQGGLSSILKGKVLYIAGDHFSTPVTITPWHRKSARMAPADGWDITPTSRLETGETYTLINVSTHDKTKINVN